MNIITKELVYNGHEATLTFKIDMDFGTLSDINSLIEDVEQKLQWRTQWNMEARQRDDERKQEQALAAAKEQAIETAKKFLNDNNIYVGE